MKQRTAFVSRTLGLAFVLVFLPAFVNSTLCQDVVLSVETASGLSWDKSKSDSLQTSAQVAFADFKVVVEPDEKELELDVKGTFTLGQGNDGINLFKEKTAIKVGSMSVLILPNSFKQGSRGKAEFQKLIDCTYWDLFIRAASKDTFEFHLELQGVKEPATIKPADIVLTIGNDSGAAKSAS